MYAGHAAIALAAKGARPRIPLAVLVPVAFAPDWIELVLQLAGRESRMQSHSLISVGLGATVVALIYWAWSRQPGDAFFVWLAYALHWPADFITGIKPTWPGGPNVGLLLYDYPVGDVLLESAVIVLCWLYYRRSLPADTRNRRIGLLIPVGLVALQIAFAAIQNPLIKEPLRDMTTRLYP